MPFYSRNSLIHIALLHELRLARCIKLSGTSPQALNILFYDVLNDIVHVPFFVNLLKGFKKKFDEEKFLLYICIYEGIEFPWNKLYFIVEKGRKKRDARRNFEKIAQTFCDK